MSIFGKIKDAIFGHKATAGTTAQRTAAQQPTTAQSTAAQPRPTQGQQGQQRQQSAAPAAQASPAAQQGRAAPPPPPTSAARAAPAAQQVDVEAILEGMAAKSGQQLNWRTSIVDLMKLLGMESSLAERKELAQELGYTGALDGSAEMNLWLHKRVMQELAAHGGKVPSSMLH